MRTKRVIFGEVLRSRAKKLNTICLKIIEKAPKIAITVCKFSKISGEASLRTPLELSLFLNQLQICSAEKKNTLEKNVEIMAPPFEISRYATDTTKTIFKYSGNALPSTKQKFKKHYYKKTQP